MRTGRQEPAEDRLPAPFLFALFLCVLAGAAGLRLADLGNRPMHCDEAVHAIKFGRLLQEDDYVYNPREYHGPSLNYLTLPIAYLADKRQLTEISETHLRLLPAIFGIALIGPLWLLRDELGHAAVFWAALLTAVSPAMVFFSRYYIHEMLLVCFTFGAIVAFWRLLRPSGDEDGVSTTGGSGPNRLSTGFWLVVLGVCIGMMHTSKETCVIALFAMVVAAPLTATRLWRLGSKRLLPAALIVAIVAAGVSMLLFSSLLRNPGGIVDSVTTYFVYLGRSSGEGSVGRHVYPWNYYLEHLFWFQRGEGPLWTELTIGVLALVGLAATALGKGLKPSQVPLARFLGVYTVLMTLIYSAMPYKTPWCALGFLHGMILLGGIGAAVLVRLMPHGALKAAAVVLLLAAAGHLGRQAYRASFVAYEDPYNPYVYAHTTSDVLDLVRRAEQIATAHPDGCAMHVQVISPDADHWPLPWYLRHFTRVGWYSQMPEGPSAPLIISPPCLEAQLTDYVLVRQPPGQRYLYVPVPPEGQDEDWQLRPGVPLRMYTRLSLWDAFSAGRELNAPAGP
ncbi:MAG: TIGR03663 family protein [Pirellulales bacterium]|nr:TIGR03663 family protein [Pirellulales bacterium]